MHACRPRSAAVHGAEAADRHPPLRVRAIPAGREPGGGATAGEGQLQGPAVLRPVWPRPSGGRRLLQLHERANQQAALICASSVLFYVKEKLGFFKTKEKEKKKEEKLGFFF